MAQQALGLIETKGLIPAVEALDSALKAADVKYVGSRRSARATSPCRSRATSRRSRPRSTPAPRPLAAWARCSRSTSSPGRTKDVAKLK